MDMTGFDPSTMTYLATQMAQPTVGDNADPFQDMMMPMGVPDQHSTYGYAGSEEPAHHSLQQPPPQQSTPSLKRFSMAYEDPFSDVVSAFEAPVNNDTQDPETPSIERDNKLLGFSLPSFNYALLDYTYRRTTISLAAQLHGMFFLAESPWSSGKEVQPAPTELTCYRRNLFQITGEITLPRTLRYIMTEHGEQIAILGQELVVSATESTEGNAVKIISVPWKTPGNPTQSTYEDRAEREPPAIPLDLMNVPDIESDFASFPFQWKRLQFRSATANNGRRRELQQHFVVRLKVLASLATGGKIPICEVQTGAIIVRGRSPRNFQARKDRLLNEQGRKASQIPRRGSTGESTRKQDNNVAAPAPPFKTETPAHNFQQEPPAFFDPNDAHLDNSLFDWGDLSAVHQGPLTALPHTGRPFEDANADTAINQNYAYSSPDLHRNAPQRPSTSQSKAPIDLSLVEEDSPATAAALNTHQSRNQYPTTTTTQTPTSDPSYQNKTSRLSLPSQTQLPHNFSLPTSLNSPDESADLLYEYFPLGLDDWMPPVDAVYRPHVVHHTKLPTDPRDPRSSKVGGKGGGRNKRYFSEDVS
ncbi:hypothetical protein MBLNU230_g5392t1 [Neophaeotheca triangularis]